MNPQNIESLAPCDGKQPTIWRIPSQRASNDEWFASWIYHLTNQYNYSFLLDLLLNFDKPNDCTTVCFGLYQMKHQTCESPETMHRSSVDSPTKDR